MTCAKRIKDATVPKRVMTHSRMSISTFAGTSTEDATLSTLNTGVVEIMFLVVCDKIIYQKIKLIIAMDMAGATVKHLKLTPDQAKKTCQVVLETEEGTQTTTFTDYHGSDDIINDLESVLLGQVSVLNQLLRQYNLKDEIQKLYPTIDMSKSVLPWKQICFTRLRRELTEIFRRQAQPMSFHRQVPPRPPPIRSVGSVAGTAHPASSTTTLSPNAPGNSYSRPASTSKQKTKMSGNTMGVLTSGLSNGHYNTGGGKLNAKFEEDVSPLSHEFFGLQTKK
ncbi:hypothetical protein HDV05_005930 [Chytridiales sp. JEL 0842]|nr:hypothetical protein HDV05_005930 [Chytridiales sp. JEL 0842]